MIRHQRLQTFFLLFLLLISACSNNPGLKNSKGPEIIGSTFPPPNELPPTDDIKLGDQTAPIKDALKQLPVTDPEQQEAIEDALLNLDQFEGAFNLLGSGQILEFAPAFAQAQQAAEAIAEKLDSVGLRELAEVFRHLALIVPIGKFISDQWHFFSPLTSDKSSQSAMSYKYTFRGVAFLTYRSSYKVANMELVNCYAEGIGFRVLPKQCTGVYRLHDKLGFVSPAETEFTPMPLFLFERFGMPFGQKGLPLPDSFVTIIPEEGKKLGYKNLGVIAFPIVAPMVSVP